MAPRKPKPPEFPNECCGVCAFSMKTGDDWQCWAHPPAAVVVCEQVGWASRGASIEPSDPICMFFKPRCHA